VIAGLSVRSPRGLAWPSAIFGFALLVFVAAELWRARAPGCGDCNGWYGVWAAMLNAVGWTLGCGAGFLLRNLRRLVPPE